MALLCSFLVGWFVFVFCLQTCGWLCKLVVGWLVCTCFGFAGWACWSWLPCFGVLVGWQVDWFGLCVLVGWLVGWFVYGLLVYFVVLLVCACFVFALWGLLVSACLLYLADSCLSFLE